MKKCSPAAIIRSVTQRALLSTEALRDDPNNGCEGKMQNKNIFKNEVQNRAENKALKPFESHSCVFLRFLPQRGNRFFSIGHSLRNCLFYLSRPNWLSVSIYTPGSRLATSRPHTFQGVLRLLNKINKTKDFSESLPWVKCGPAVINSSDT